MYHTKVHSIVSVLWFCFETSEMFSKSFRSPQTDH